MYNKLLNSIFNLYVCCDKSKALNYARNYVAPEGVKNTLLERLAANELKRHGLFSAQFKEQFAPNPISKLEERIKGRYLNGLM